MASVAVELKLVGVFIFLASVGYWLLREMQKLLTIYITSEETLFRLKSGKIKHRPGHSLVPQRERQKNKAKPMKKKAKAAAETGNGL
jgi:hypothetical protein